MNSSELRLRVLTLKHKVRKKLFEFLESPNAPIYLKVMGVLLAFLLVIIFLQIIIWICSLASYHSDPVAYLKNFYDPLTPRFVDTTDYRTSDDNVFDLEAYKEELFQINEYNTYLSDKLPINRLHKDPRSERCRNKAKKLPEELSPTSIIIVMFNEELSVILRTIVSILLNTPMESVKEVIIVDDRSNKDELGDRLEQELANFPFVRLIRNSKREGLIRSRIIGSKAAIGSILLFLDSHVEMGKGWFQPLVARVMEDPKTIVCPIIATLDHTTLDLVPGKLDNIWGIWDWDMSFRWVQIPPREAQRRAFDDSSPIRTPAMAGGLFAINKDFFFDLGAYDPGMKIWGAENLEMSFRTWMCGGAIEINTCSIVGHIFRRAGVIQKSVSGELAMKQNTKRAVDVWLDQYKDTHFIASPSSKKVDGGDIVPRVLLRQRLNCKSFDWYLDQVFPEQYRPERDLVAYGQLKGPSNVCMDTMGPGVGHQVGVFACHGEGSNQFWKLLLSGELRNGALCLDGDGENPRNVVTYECHGLRGNQQWFITEERVLKHGGSGKCLSHDGKHLLLLPCDSEEDDTRFTWSFGAETDKLLERFYEMYAKQFRYKTKKEREAEEKVRSKRKVEVKAAQKRKEEEEKQLRESEKEKRDKLEEENRLVEESKQKEAEQEQLKRAKEEEEFLKWKAAIKEKEHDVMKGQEEEEKLKLRMLEEDKERKRFEFEKRKLKDDQQQIDIKDEKSEINKTKLLDTNEGQEFNSQEEAQIKRLKMQAAENLRKEENLRNLDSQESEKQVNSEHENVELDVIDQNGAESKDLENSATNVNLDSKKDNDSDMKLNSNKSEIDDTQMKEFLAWKAAQGKKVS